MFTVRHQTSFKRVKWPLLLHTLLNVMPFCVCAFHTAQWGEIKGLQRWNKPAVWIGLKFNGWQHCTAESTVNLLSSFEHERSVLTALVLCFAAYSVPSKKRKTTVMEQVSTLVSATVAQLREMDAAMQAQEEARLQRLMKHEREMQNNLISQLMAMNERISQENHERNLELVDRILSRFPSQSASSGPWLTLPGSNGRNRIIHLWDTLLSPLPAD